MQQLHSDVWVTSSPLRFFGVEIGARMTVVRLSDDSPVEVTIYDLSGRAVRRLVERRAVSTGEYAIGWDGKDASGGLVPPGIYYARLRLAADKGGISTSKTEVLRMVSVAY